MKKKKNETQKLIQENPVEKQVNGEHIDMSSPVYNNCLFYQIDTAFFGNPQQIHNMKNIKTEGDVTNEEIEAIRKQMIAYISASTSFAPEMVERVLDQAENFMKGKYPDSFEEQ